MAAWLYPTHGIAVAQKEAKNLPQWPATLFSGGSRPTAPLVSGMRAPAAHAPASMVPRPTRHLLGGDMKFEGGVLRVSNAEGLNNPCLCSAALTIPTDDRDHQFS